VLEECLVRIGPSDDELELCERPDWNSEKLLVLAWPREPR
jgi:hypothetical protein